MTDYETLPFADAEAWSTWLAAHHADTDGVWVKIHKKATRLPTVTYAQALDVALCYGWIDGQRKSFDEQSFIQKFTPRRTKSLWSKRNIEHIDRLTGAGLIQPAGRAEVERAKADGRWGAAYDTQRDMVIPESFMIELRKNATALAFFETLNKSNRFAIGWRLQTAKTEETCLRRQAKILAMLEAGEAFHS